MQAPPPHFGNQFTQTLHEEPNASTEPSRVSLPEGYTVLITGAGKGIGEYIARAYAEAKASNIIITSRTASDLDRVKASLEEIAKQHGRSVNVRTHPSDASRLETYKDLKAIVEKDFSGRLDCLINNAGSIGSTAGFRKRLHETDPEEHAKLYDLNYLGPMYAMQQLIPAMLNEQSKGRLIVNISSAACHMTSNSPMAYNSSKFALNRLNQHVGENYAEEGLVSIALHPGGVQSAAAEHVPDWMKARKSGICHLCCHYGLQVLTYAAQYSKTTSRCAAQSVSGLPKSRGPGHLGAG